MLPAALRLEATPRQPLPDTEPVGQLVGSPLGLLVEPQVWREGAGGARVSGLGVGGRTSGFEWGTGEGFWHTGGFMT